MLRLESRALWLLGLIAYVLAMTMYWGWRGADAASDQLAFDLLLLVVVPALAPAVFIVGIVRALPMLVAEREAQAAEIALRPGDALRDWRMRDLFHHIRSDVLDGSGERPVWQVVGEQVRQTAADGRVKVWGRRCAESGLNLDNFDEPPTFELIAPERWHNAKFTYQFFAENTDHQCQLRVRDGPQATKFYCDLRVSREESERVWRH